MEFLFWVAIFGVLYSYFIYPMLLLFLPKSETTELGEHTDELPSISLIIAAHNEQDRIESKINNCLDIDYPKDRLEIIFASDGSTDATIEIAQKYKDQNITVLDVTDHLGKENAQLQAINQAKGDIYVFSDIATIIAPITIKLIVRKFNDKRIGAVSSVDKFLSQDGNIAGEGAYIKYEMWLRSLESARGGLIGLSGSFFAARKEVCRPWHIHCDSDFNVALNSCMLGYQAISASDVLGYYYDIDDPKKEYARKVRTVIRGLTTLSHRLESLNPFKFGLQSFKVWSHKVMRWAVPWFLCLLFIANIFLFDSSDFYSFTLWTQIAGYLLILAAHFSARLQNISLIKILYSFIQVNVAIAHATVAFIGGKRMSVWKPSTRSMS